MAKLDALRFPVQRDIRARLLLNPNHDCLDLRDQYPAVPTRTFSRYVRSGRLAIAGEATPGVQAGAPCHQQTQPTEIMPPHGLVPMASNQGALDVAAVRQVFFEAWEDSLAAKGLAFDLKGALVNPAWLDASIVARDRLSTLHRSWAVDLLGRREAELRGILDAAYASSSDLGDLCERWINEFALARWAKCCPPAAAARLRDLLRDAELTRPYFMGGRGKAGSPAAFKRSVVYRARWIGVAAGLLETFWSPDAGDDVLSHMVDRLVALGKAGHAGIVVEWGQAMKAWKEPS